MDMIRYVSLATLCGLLMTACSNEGTPGKTGVDMAGKKTVKDVFQSRCAACHGDDGTNGTGNAPDLSASQLNELAIFQVIQNGRAGMPAFKTILTESEIKEISEYVFSLQNK